MNTIRGIEIKQSLRKMLRQKSMNMSILAICALVITWGSCQLTYAQGSSRFSLNEPTTVLTDEFVQQPLTSDIDGDHDLDLLVISSTRLNVFKNLGQRSFSSPAVYSLAGPLRALAADLNQDSYPDVVVTSVKNDFSRKTHQYFANVYLNDGSGSFNSSKSYALCDPLSGLTSSIVPIDTADLNADGKLEIIAAITQTGKVVILQNKGGSFSKAGTYSASDRPGQLRVVDYNGDSILDVVTSSLNTDSAGVLLGSSDGSYSYKSLEMGDHTSDIKLGDIDNDGIADLVFGGFWKAQVLIQPGQAAGGFGALYSLSLPANVTDLAILDVDGDGLNDLVAASGTSRKVSVRHADKSSHVYSVSDLNWYFVVSDLDSDMLPDVVTGVWASQGGKLQLFYNHTRILGDLDCDGKVGFNDIDAFTLALYDSSNYSQTYPLCERLRADINEDSSVDFGDIDPFVELLSK